MGWAELAVDWWRSKPAGKPFARVLAGTIAIIYRAERTGNRPDVLERGREGMGLSDSAHFMAEVW